LEVLKNNSNQAKKFLSIFAFLLIGSLGVVCADTTNGYTNSRQEAAKTTKSNVTFVGFLLLNKSNHKK